MTREIIGLLMISLVAIIAVIIWLRTRSKRALQEGLIAKPSAATSVGQFKTFYVSTVFRNQPLDRVWAHGFGMRGKAEVGVASDGVSVYRNGEASFLMPRVSISELGSASATIDKGVERDGLTAIRWSLGETEMVTHFRFTDHDVRKEFESKVLQLIGAQIG